jgi:RNA polymerase sigma-70 factor (ECF subfamily)
VSKLSFLINFSARRRVEAMRPRLKRLAHSWCHDTHLADDLAQEALTRALDRLDQLHDEAALEGWLFAILNNCWRDHLRRGKDFVQVEDLDEAVFQHDSTPEQLYATRQTTQRVRRAVDRLPMGQRQVLTLIDLEECSYAEVAAIMAIPVGTVMSRLYRARQALKADLQREEAIVTKTNLRRVK